MPRKEEPSDMKLFHRLTKIAELVTGVGVFACALWVYFRTLLLGASLTEMLLLLLVLVAPGFLVALGCYLQAVRCKVWAMGWY